jgi:hypothetical protein
MERAKGPQIGFSEMWLDEGRSDRRTSGGNVVPCRLISTYLLPRDPIILFRLALWYKTGE